MRTITGKEAAGRGRDLEILTVDVIAARSRTTLNAVICPKEQRTRPVEECVPCVDGTGPVKDPASRAGYFGCEAQGGAVVQPSGGSSNEAQPVTNIMTRGVVAFCSDVTIEGARAEMLERGVAGAPVVDREGHPVGLLTYFELVRAAADAVPASAVIADVMLRRAFAVADTAPIAEVAAMMASEGVAQVPVVSREGRVVGVVTALDLVRWVAVQEDRGARPLP